MRQIHFLIVVCISPLADLSHDKHTHLTYLNKGVIGESVFNLFFSYVIRIRSLEIFLGSLMDEIENLQFQIFINLRFWE